MTSSKTSTLLAKFPASSQGAAVLARERAACSFSASQLSDFVLGAELRAKLHEISSVVASEVPELTRNDHVYMGRAERIRQLLSADARLAQIMRDRGWGFRDRWLVDGLTERPGQLSLHYLGFMEGIQLLGDDAQRATYLEQARRLEIIGAYAQTEVGHGSNISQLETTATFMPATDEFEIHSPSLTASKWWIGGLGLAATHVLLMARLVVDGANYGPHAFIVQVRSLDTHAPLPGVTVGDIGPKLGLNEVDNGFVLFDRVRIPRRQMLSRFAQLSRAGEYAPAANARLAYAFMVSARCTFFDKSAAQLTKAAVVATRYALVRHQFSGALKEHQLDTDSSGLPAERPVLDYPGVQHRIFPVIAQAYAHFLASKSLQAQYQAFLADLEAGDLTSLADMHAASSCLKALGTSLAIDGTETCRRSMGGHGFHMASGLGESYVNSVPAATFEGDNFLLAQQTGRYMAKVYPEIAAAVAAAAAAADAHPGSGRDSGRADSTARADGSRSATAQYISQYLQLKHQHQQQQQQHQHSRGALFKLDSYDDVLDPHTQLALFGHRAAWHAEHIAQLAQQHGGEFIHHGQVRMVRAQEAHGLFLVLRGLLDHLRIVPVTPDLPLPPADAIAHLRLIANVYAVSTLERFHLADLLESGAISGAQATLIRDTLEKVLLPQMRPVALALVEAIGWPELSIRSALGAQDGRAYERMFEMALGDPVNHDGQAVYRGWFNDTVKPLMRAGGGAHSKL